MSVATDRLQQGSAGEAHLEVRPGLQFASARRRISWVNEVLSKLPRDPTCATSAVVVIADRIGGSGEHRIEWDT